MDKVTHPVYRDYPEQPYISPDRDLDAWLNTPERFPYGRVSRANMERTPEGLLPGQIVMLWLMDVSHMTNESIMPQYFEYRYGVQAQEAKDFLVEKGYASIAGVEDALPLLNAEVIKRMLKSKNLPLSGKKGELVGRVLHEFDQKELAELVGLRLYQVSPQGKELLARHGDIIKRHGPKKL